MTPAFLEKPRRMSLSQRQLALLLIAPGLALVAGLFIYPLSFSLISAFTGPEGGFSLQSFGKAWELYSGDVLFTVVIVFSSCVFTGLAAIVIAGTLTLGENRYIVGTLKALYRWPLFIPFIVAAQCMRTFLAKNGLMNNTFVSLGLMEPLQAVSFLDWRGIIATFQLAGLFGTAIAVTTHTIIGATTQVHQGDPIVSPAPGMIAVTSRATKVDTMPMPPRKAGALRWATRASHGARTLCSTAKITIARMNPNGLRQSIVKPGSTMSATMRPTAADARKTRARRRNVIMTRA